MKYIKFIFMLALLPILMGCNKERKYFPNNPEEPIKVIRFDSAIVHIDQNDVTNGVRALYRSYPTFITAWVEDILGIPSEDTATLVEQLPKFLNDTVYGFRTTNQTEQEEYADIADIRANLNSAFGRIHSLYPDWEKPTIYLMVSGFQTSVYFVDDTTIAVGADMYLGSQYEYYNKLVYNYQKQTMRRECMVADIVSAYLFHHIDYTANEARLIDQMIYRGKVMYLLKQINPQPEYEVIGWDKKSWDWCCDNEEGIWMHMMDTRDIYATDALTISNYLNDGPFCSEISQDCPARVGTWIGMRIVRSYMENNRNVTLQQLMEEGDTQAILTKSKYKP